MKFKFFPNILFFILLSCFSAMIFPAPIYGQSAPETEIQQPAPDDLDVLNGHQKPTNLVQPSASHREVQVPALPAQPNPDPVPDNTNALGLIWAWITKNTAEAILALLGILKIITNLTPSEKDDKWYDLVERFISTIIPNLRKNKGGGVDLHPKP